MAIVLKLLNSSTLNVTRPNITFERIGEQLEMMDESVSSETEVLNQRTTP